MLSYGATARMAESACGGGSGSPGAGIDASAGEAADRGAFGRRCPAHPAAIHARTPSVVRPSHIPKVGICMGATLHGSLQPPLSGPIRASSAKAIDHDAEPRRMIDSRVIDPPELYELTRHSSPRPPRRVHPQAG